MTYKVIALTRMICPEANIPSTTALATINRELGRELGLMRGANVVMPNLTPSKYRALYEIYPSKACIGETAWECHSCLTHRIQSIGRRVGVGRGDRIHRIDSMGSLLVERKARLKKEGFKDKGLLI
jgi:biotin synthase